jgi:hypothetical protein
VHFSTGGNQFGKSLETDNHDEAHHRAYPFRFSEYAGLRACEDEGRRRWNR